MNTTFPSDFIWGTSTAAAQIETASAHEWNGLKARDGAVFYETIRHEQHREQDAAFISDLGNSYRLSLDWARLQKAPLAPFNPEVVKEYRSFIKSLKARGLSIMLVSHHFTNPIWFSKAGHWTSKTTQSFFLDYVNQLASHFSDLTDLWNTFNEPMVYLVNAFLLGNFPPYRKNAIPFYKALNNMAMAHHKAYDIIRRYSAAPIGISKNTVWFYARNFIGSIPSSILNHLFNSYGLSRFISKLDFIGISYYAKIGMDPFPITYLDTPEKIDRHNLQHDMMWEYDPRGLEKYIRQFWERYKMPIYITENGIATESSDERIGSIKDYLSILSMLIEEGIDIRGYYHWSTFDNFEWHLGRKYTFGLVEVDSESYERKLKACGDFYKSVVRENGF